MTNFDKFYVPDLDDADPELGNTLRRKAAELFAAQHPNRGERVENVAEVTLGVIPGRDGVTVVTLQRPLNGGGGPPYLTFREWSVGPDGKRDAPMKRGMSFTARQVPQIAGILAKALDVMTRSQELHNATRFGRDTGRR